MTYRPTYRPTAAAAVTLAAAATAAVAGYGDDAERDPLGALRADADAVAVRLGAVRGDVVTYADAAVALAVAAHRATAAVAEPSATYADAVAVVLAAAAYVGGVVADACGDPHAVDYGAALAARRSAQALGVVADVVTLLARRDVDVAHVLADPRGTLAGYAAR